MTLAAVTSLPFTGARLTNNEVFELWEMHMNAADCAKRTIRERKILLDSYGRFIDVPIIGASRMHLISFIARDHLSAKTKQNYRSFLHTLYTLLQDEGMRADNPSTRLPRGKVPRTEANPLSTAQVQKLIDATAHRKTRMMILLAAYQGFRAVEIASVSGLHIDLEQQQILTVDAKGGFEVWRPIHPLVWELAQDFPKDDWWFPGQRTTRGHVAAKSVSNTLVIALHRAGVEGHRPHNLRAWYATELVESGADMLTVQHAMRHASAATLKYYVRPSIANIQEAILRLPLVEVHRQKN